MPFAQDQIKQIGAGVLPAVAIALLPKCPLCWIAILGSLGTGSVIAVAWLEPLTIFFLALAVGAIAFRARRVNSLAPLVLGAAAAVGIYIFKFTAVSDGGVYISAAALIGASVWNSVLKSTIKTPGCTCEGHAGQERS